MTTEFLIPALLATALAGLVRGFTGFGGALVMAPVLLTLIDPVSTTAIVIIVNVVAGVLQAREIHREADWSIAKPLCYAALLTAPIGLWSIHVLDIERVRQIVGAIVLLATVALLLRWRFPFSIRQPLGTAALGGSSGFLFGLGGIGGPPVVLGLLADGTPVRVARATQLAYFSLIQVFTLLVMAVSQSLTTRHLLFGALLSPVYYFGGLAGGRLLTPAREPWFRRASIGVLLAVSGFALWP